MSLQGLHFSYYRILYRVLSQLYFRSPCAFSKPTQYRAVVHPRNATRANPARRNIIRHSNRILYTVDISMSYYYNPIFSSVEPITNFPAFRSPRATTGSGVFEMTRCALTFISLKPARRSSRDGENRPRVPEYPRPTDPRDLCDKSTRFCSVFLSTSLFKYDHVSLLQYSYYTTYTHGRRTCVLSACVRER